jgi:pSer/pThr/pTyr-binding forkhead associated (FHA) protein
MKKTLSDISATVASSLETREIDAARLLQYFDQLAFTRLPEREPDGEVATDKIWRIVLINLVTRQEPVTVEIWDEISIGRRVGAPNVDLDLSQHNGLELGVSRVHASLRPTDEALLLYDMGSTNGTYANNIKATANEPLKLKDNDIISFGALKFLVKVVHFPGMKPIETKRKIDRPG